MQRSELTVEGMTCGGCSSRLKRVLEAADGVFAAQVVLETGQATVDHDATRIDVAAIERVIHDAGFSVRGR